ncbi:hypothetical protein OP10G_3298 [Fimbriimonas ginsengisoli Gsoil 348]|uniref:O-antigen polymerase n=1 Tax=Fimbriimonas ginsengisoli Gsoil 348 TaxID=661478 RepID=A0A068NTA8_FIMGI|nr:hypothetical protein OP10G_3298 [Fimbriimonas ginsengisoli Gsoil 348]
MAGLLKFSFVGELGARDILVIVLAPFYIRKATQIVRMKPFRTFLSLGVIYFVSLVTSDFVRQSAEEDYFRGWAKILIFLLTLFLAPALLDGKPWRMAAYMVGSLMVILASAAAGPTLPLYKFYLAIPVSCVCFIGAGYLSARFGRMALILPLLSGLVALSQNARSAAGMTLLATGILSLWILDVGKATPSKTKLRRKSIAAICTMVLGILAILGLYKYAASNGLLGKEGQEKYETQISISQEDVGPFDIVLGGRNEMLFSVPEILRSPIIGYGSWAKDYEFVHSRSYELGIQKGSVRTTGRIPTHSFLLQGWVEAGICGGIFWMFALLQMLRTLFTGTFNTLGVWGPLFCYTITQLSWDLLFSPFGGERKVEVGFMLAIVSWMAVIARREQQAQIRLRTSVEATA